MSSESNNNNLVVSSPPMYVVYFSPYLVIKNLNSLESGEYSVDLTFSLTFRKNLPEEKQFLNWVLNNNDTMNEDSNINVDNLRFPYIRMNDESVRDSEVEKSFKLMGKENFRISYRFKTKIKNNTSYKDFPFDRPSLTIKLELTGFSIHSKSELKFSSRRLKPEILTNYNENKEIIHDLLYKFKYDHSAIRNDMIINIAATTIDYEEEDKTFKDLGFKLRYYPSMTLTLYGHRQVTPHLINLLSPLFLILLAHYCLLNFMNSNLNERLTALLLLLLIFIGTKLLRIKQVPDQINKNTTSFIEKVELIILTMIGSQFIWIFVSFNEIVSSVIIKSVANYFTCFCIIRLIAHVVSYIIFHILYYRKFSISSIRGKRGEEFLSNKDRDIYFIPESYQTNLISIQNNKKKL